MPHTNGELPHTNSNMVQESKGYDSQDVAPTEDMISVGGLMYVLRKWLWIIILVPFLLTTSVVGFSLLQPPMYQASIKILVGQVEDPEDATSLQTLTRTMEEAVNSRPVANAVIDELNLKMTPEKFLENMNAEAIPETQFIEVSYTASDPSETQRTANTIGEVFAEKDSKVISESELLTATVYERAQLPDTPTSPNPLLYGFLAFVIGGVLGLWLAFLLENLGDRWQSLEEIEQVSVRSFRFRGDTPAQGSDKAGEAKTKQ